MCYELHVFSNFMEHDMSTYYNVYLFILFMKQLYKENNNCLFRSP